MTLIEVLISVLIVSLITGGIVSAMLTALNIFDPTSHRVLETNDSQTIAAFLTSDAQAAGGTNPSTGALDTTHNLGVSMTDDAGCTTAGATLLLRFKWFHRTTTFAANGEQNVVVNVANYYFVPSSNVLIRTTCDSGATPVPPSTATLGSPSQIQLATTVQSVTASCDGVTTSCPSFPDTVALTITATNQAGPSNPVTSPYTYTVSASLRPEGEIPPCDSTIPGCTNPTGTVDPLIALGVCSGGGTDLDVGGSAQVDVNGGITGSSNCDPMKVHLSSGGSLQSGAVTYTGNTVDPFAGIVPPVDTCSTATSNPATTTVGGVTHYHPGTYKTDPTVSGNATVVFDPGNYVFCSGVSITGNNTNVSGSDVLFYIKGGTASLNGGTVNLTGRQSQLPGDRDNYTGLLIWQAAADTTSPMVIAGGTLLNLGGIIYAPSITVQLRGNSNTFFVKAVIAGAVSFSGTTGIVIGTPPPQMSITAPTSLVDWTAGVAYPSTAVSVTGGSGGNTFTVTGLPTGLSFNAVTRTISGTPTATGLFSPQIKVVDSDGDVAIVTFSMTINGAPTITGPTTLPSADVTRSYPPPFQTAVMTAAGGTGPGYVWTATGLPPGLTLDSQSGNISGSPTTVGSYTPTIKLTDAAGATDTKSYASSPIVISALPAITAPSGSTLPPWTSGQGGYSQQITVTGGTGPFTWQLSAAPPGLTISNSGLITGTPTGPQTYSMVVTATDADGVAASQTYGVTINPAVTVNCSVPNGEIAVPYSGSCTVSGGTSPYNFTWAGVPGLTLDPSTGAITGTPTVANTYSRTITVTDSGGTNFPKTVSFVINPAPTITTGSLPSWTWNQDYGSSNTTMKGSGGLTPYVWTDGNTLPPGLSLNSATGQITGTPTTVGSYTVTITLTDAANVQATQTYLVRTNGLPSITTGSPLPDGEQTVAYSTPIQATGGTPDAGGHYQWTISSGLPNGSGLSINGTTGVISGTPNVSGSYTVTIVATDVSGATDSVQLQLLLTVAPSVTTASLPAATQTQTGYSQTLTAAGGTGAMTWTLTTGSLPAGLALSSAGVISGNLGAGATTRTFTVTATDSVGGVATKSLTLTVNPPPSITTGSLPNATRTQVGYSQTLSASGGTGPIGWTVSTGTLPTGLNLSPGGVISGSVDPAATTQTFTVTATDANGVATNKSLTITVQLRPTIVSVALVNSGAGGSNAGTIDKADQIVITFSQQMSVASLCTGGSAPWTNDGADQSLNDATVTVTHGTHDVITVASPSCTFNFGSIDLGSNLYVNATMTFGGSPASAIAWSAASDALTITLGKNSSNAAKNVGSSTPVYTAGSITDSNGVTLSNSPFTLPTQQQF
jgi:hypothetical protein